MRPRSDWVIPVGEVVEGSPVFMILLFFVLFCELLLFSYYQLLMYIADLGDGNTRFTDTLSCNVSVRIELSYLQSNRMRRVLQTGRGLSGVLPYISPNITSNIQASEREPYLITATEPSRRTAMHAAIKII